MNTPLNMENHPLGTKLRQYADTLRSMLRALPGLHWLVAVLFCAALAATGLTLIKLKTVVSASRSMQAEQPVTYKLERIPLTANEYTAILEWFARLHPEVQFDVPKSGGLTVSIKDGNFHADWMYALGALQSRDLDVVWEPETFCVGRCPGAAATALVKGYRQKIVQNK